MEAYYNTMDKIGDAIIDWHDPGGNFRGNREGWCLSDFPSAITVVLAYLAFVLVGTRFMEDKPAMNTYPFKFIYNVSQIFICAYMTIEAALLAFSNGYAIFPSSGNDFNKNDAAFSNLLWIFHISKVRCNMHEPKSKSSEVNLAFERSKTLKLVDLCLL